MIGATVEWNKRKDRITYVDKPTSCSKVVLARVRKCRQAQGQARQTESKRENWYVIKVIKSKPGKGDMSFCPREPKVVRSLLIGL